MSDLIKRLRGWPGPRGGEVPYVETMAEAATEIEKLRAENAKLAASNHAYLSNYQEAATEIEKLRAAVQDLAKHVWRGDWDKLKPETRAVLGEKE
jgi:hypothetical protein